MILPYQQDALHKAWLYRLLINLADQAELNQLIFFKGGTCAAMLGWLDRFSVDLDFDLAAGASKDELRPILKRIFKNLGLKIKDESRQALQFFLRYEAPDGQRHTLKLEILDKVVKANDYKPQYLAEIDRYVICQTQETMAANKLVAVTERYSRFKTIAGRDIYDLHYWLSRGIGYKKAVVEERTQMPAAKYLQELTKFIEVNVNQTIIDEDLNTLLMPKQFRAIRKTLKQETLMLLRNQGQEGIIQPCGGR